MNRKEFLQASALLFPASALGMAHVNAPANTSDTPENYLASPSYQKTSSDFNSTQTENSRLCSSQMSIGLRETPRRR